MLIVIRYIKRISDFFRSSERGNVVAISVFSSIALIGITGLAVDYGTAVLLETKLQQATDSSALAGVQDLPYLTYAKNTMTDYFTENYTYANNCTVETDGSSKECWIIAEHQIPTHFMRIFGMDSLTINARSKARLENIEGMKGGIGIMPFVLINPNENSNPYDDLVKGNHGKPYLLKYAEDNIMVEDWYYGRQQVADGLIHADKSFIDGGWRSVLALDPNSMNPSDYSNAATDYRENFANGWKGFVKIGDILGSNPGVMVSGTTQGRNDRLDGVSTVTWEGFDANLDPLNKRIMCVPIVTLGRWNEDGNWLKATPEDVVNGNYTWKESRVDGFATFFLLSENEQKALPGGKELNRKWVVGRFIYGANVGGVILSPSESTAPDFGMFQGRLIPF